MICLYAYKTDSITGDDLDKLWHCKVFPKIEQPLGIVQIVSFTQEKTERLLQFSWFARKILNIPGISIERCKVISFLLEPSQKNQSDSLNWSYSNRRNRECCLRTVYKETRTCSLVQYSSVDNFFFRADWLFLFSIFSKYIVSCHTVPFKFSPYNSQPWTESSSSSSSWHAWPTRQPRRYRSTLKFSSSITPRSFRWPSTPDPWKTSPPLPEYPPWSAWAASDEPSPAWRTCAVKPSASTSANTTETTRQPCASSLRVATYRSISWHPFSSTVCRRRSRNSVRWWHRSRRTPSAIFSKFSLLCGVTATDPCSVLDFPLVCFFYSSLWLLLL